MHFQKSIGLAFCGALLGGCAIHPVQQDVTRIPTAQIVQQIRCETRFAILTKALQLIEDHKLRPYETQETRDTHLRQIAEKLDAPITKESLRQIRSNLYDDEKAFFDQYINTAIAFVFNFDVQEQNTYGVSINPVQAITGGSIGVAFGASADFVRGNKRFFELYEYFQHNLTDQNLDCRSFQTQPNFAYPISGSIGVFDVISTFIDINRAQPLSRGGDAIAALDGKSPNLADTLQFMTTLQASAKPSFALSPTGSSVTFAAADNYFSPLAKRTDNHQLIIGLALTEPAALDQNPVKHRATAEGKKADKKSLPEANGPNTLLFRKPSSLPTIDPLLAAPTRQQGSAAPSAADRALLAARNQLLLNFYSRTLR